MKRVLKRLVLLIMFLGALFALLCWLAASRLISPTRRALQDYHQVILGDPSEHGMRIEAFQVGAVPCLMCEPVIQPGAATKGRKLRDQLQAMSVPLEDWGTIRGTLVLLHGHTGRKEDHLPVAERFCAVGFRCLLVDMPGHGDHPDPFASFGFREAELPLMTLKEASRRFSFSETPAALFGISQGGAIVLQAAALPDSPWWAVAELSSFDALDHVIDHEGKRWFSVASTPAAAVVKKLVHLRAGFNPHQIRPVDAAARLTIPVLFGHGDQDAFIPPSHAQTLLQAATQSPRKEFLNIPSAGHSNVLVTDAPVYATLSRFFLDTLSGPN